MDLAIITGVNRGLGKAVYDQIKKMEDCLILAISRNRPSGFDNGNIFVKKDLSLIESAFFLTSIIEYDKYERIVFINNAATINPIESIGKLKEEEFLDAFRLNAISPILICNELIAKAKGELVLINITSGAAKRPIVGWGTYCASKAAVLSFFEVLMEQEKNNNNIQVINFDPGVMDTEMQTTIRNSDLEAFPDLIQFQNFETEDRLRRPDDVAKEIVKMVW